MLGTSLHKIITMPEWKIPNQDDFHNHFDPLYLRFEQFKNLIIQDFGTEGVYILALFFILLTLIVLIYIKSLINFFKSAQPDIEENEYEEEDTTDEIYELPDLSSKRETALLEKDQELSQNIIRMAEESASQHEEKEPKEILPLKKRIKLDAGYNNKKIRNINIEISANTKSEDNSENKNNFGILFILILNMLGKNVSESKIAQALFSQYSSTYNEEEIICLVQTIRDLIGLYNSGKLAFLPQKDNLPDLSDALMALCKGNSTPCLVLLQALLNRQMDKADAETGVLQDLGYALAANYACIMGNIAKFTDSELAHNSYELATELSPHNVDAWNRLGDMFLTKNAPEKAMIAYQNVLDIGDKIMYAAAVANAQLRLSEYYQRQGWSDKSAELADEGNNFYNTYGIRLPLTSQEDYAYRKIAQDSANNLPSSISELLFASRNE